MAVRHIPDLEVEHDTDDGCGYFLTGATGMRFDQIALEGFGFFCGDTDITQRAEPGIDAID
jgi:hypothetical protein